MIYQRPAISVEVALFGRSTMDPTITAIQVPLHLACSHNIAQPGFESKRIGHFSDGNVWEEFASFSANDLTVIGQQLHLVSMTKISDGLQRLRVEFVVPQTEESAMEFVQHVADAITTSIASRAEDAWYGNLYVDVRWGGFEDVTPRDKAGLDVSASTIMTNQESFVFNRTTLEALSWHPLTDIFAEGIRAPEPKSKFLFWFVMLEELEKRDEFVKLFEPLYSPEQAAAVLAATESILDKAGQGRLKNLLNGGFTTKEGRPTKLLRILHEIGCSTVTCIGIDHEITKKVCKDLIEGRNDVAHRGTTIDKDLLYTVLFPLAKAALAYIVANGD